MIFFHVSLLFLFVTFNAVVLTNVHGKSIGKQSNSVRIVHGDEVTPHSLPYMVAIRTTIDDKSVLCGGSLITNTLVLTAARCLSGAAEAEVTLGAHNLDEDEASQVTLISSEFIIHPEYETDSNINDIALIELPSAVTLNENINTVTIPELSDVIYSYNEEEGLVAGWGKAKDTDITTSSVLRSVNLTVIPTLMCELSYLFTISFDQMCTSGVSQKNICLGDTGSPLVVKGVQVGIAQYGSNFGCEVGFPGVYTRMTSYISWLRETIASYEN